MSSSSTSSSGGKLAGHWQDIQKNTFSRWCNEHLRERGMHCQDLVKDLRDGILLCNLLEIISGKKIGVWNKHPRVPLHKQENCAIAISFIEKEGLKLVNISGTDIYEGREKLILGLIWTLILRYHINKGRDGGDAENDLLKWVQSKIPSYNITNFTSNWNDGKAICALVNALQPKLCPNHGSLNAADALKNATQGIEAAETQMGIAPLVMPAEMVHPKIDKLAMMTYLQQFRDWDPKSAFNPAENCSAWGPGLTEGVANKPSPFWVETEGAQGKLECKVTGPAGKNVPCTMKEEKSGQFACSYNPTEPGDYQVAITLDGVHIPGSVFHLQVLAAISLGGEGKIRVFFSTTSASEKARQDNYGLERIFSAKKVHLRTDFEPWIPVDILDREDRELVFAKAGTRKLPIVFINDLYVGDYDKIEELEEVGELQQLLDTLPATYITEEQAKNRVNTFIDGAGSVSQQFEKKPAAASSASAAPASNKVTVSGTTTGGVASVTGGAASTGAKFCSNCGTKATGGKFCGQCGGQL